MLAEINDIWWSQAGICFEIQTVAHDELLPGGFDLWFVPALEKFNGFYADQHDMRVRPS